MNFLIANTFTDSLTTLTGTEQKAVKTTAFDLQMNPANPGLKFHKVDKAKDPNFWSVRVSSDIRLIVHKSKSSLMICYVGHHDDAYKWAERRKLEIHPKTGAAQLVEIRSSVREVTVPRFVEAPELVDKTPALSKLTADDLLKYGVPAEWIDDLLLADEDELLDLTEHLPSEAAEAVLDLAVGVTPEIAQPQNQDVDPFEHPDAQRRFRVMNNVQELERAFDFPWEKWTIFLHPAQNDLVSKEYSGPARVSGTAGTGKTVVALHRAVFLARSDRDSRILLTTFSQALANSLRTKLFRLISNEPRLGDQIEVLSINEVGLRLYKSRIGRITLASQKQINDVIIAAARLIPENSFSDRFLISEWDQVVDGWQVRTWEAYRDVLRLGRKTRLAESKRKVIWNILSQVRERLQSEGLKTISEMFGELEVQLKASISLPFDYAVIDEAQDVSVAQLRFLAALNQRESDSLFFAGDLGQRIFQQPFSWKALGVDIRGRSFSLKINYRTSHQIRMKADKLLGPEVADVDGIIENRRGTISVFNGPNPTLLTFDSEAEEIRTVADWIKARFKEGLKANELGVFVRSSAEIERATAVMDALGSPYQILDDITGGEQDRVQLCTMHLAKGLEFKAVVVMACDDEVIPSMERIMAVTDDADLEDVYNTERHLLYVACTRARDNLMVSGVSPVSEFLDDLVS